MADVTNLFVGPCTLYVDGVSVGWTRGGVRMRVNKSLWARSSLSGLGADEIVKQSEDYYISTILVENTVINLRHAWGINEAAVGRKVSFGGSTTVPTHTLRFVADGSFFEAYFYKVVAVDFGEIVYSRQRDASIPATFRAILDTSKAVGEQIGYIIRGTTGSLNLVMRLEVPKIKTYTVYMQLIVRQEAGSSLVSRLSVYYTPSLLNLVSRVIVLKESSNDLVSRTTVVYILGSSNLVSRATILKESSSNLVSRVDSFGNGVNNLVCRLTTALA